MNKETKQPQSEEPQSSSQSECKSIETPQSQLQSNTNTNTDNDNNDNDNTNEDNKDIVKLPKQSLSVPYTINIIPTEKEIDIPEPIDLMSILNTSERSKSSKTVAFQQYLPKKLKKEITDEEIDEIYENIQMIKLQRKKQKVISLQNKNPKSIENLLLRNTKDNANAGTTTPIKCYKPLDQINDSNEEK